MWLWVFVVQFFQLCCICENFYNKMLVDKTYQQCSSKVEGLPGVPAIKPFRYWAFREVQAVFRAGLRWLG